MKRVVFGVLAALCALSAFAQAQPAGGGLGDRLYFGGGIGASFGDIDYVEIAPLVGYKLNPRVSLGGGIFYRWASDNRYPSSPDTNDYGASVFSRINIVPPLYAHVEFEFADYEYVTSSASTYRSHASNFLVGGGFFQPTGGHGGVYATILYNVTYDSNDPTSPYDSPWVYRVGFTIGF